LLRPGRRIAIDVGTKRIGVAVSDFHGILASPLATINAEQEVSVVWNEILENAPEEFLEVYVGLPIGLSGNETKSTENATDFASKLASLVTIPVYLVDERLSTSLANQQLREVGKSQRDARSSIDQMAAVAILEYALDIERNSGKTPGSLVEGGSHD
jgi:putative Holliday junction resolvase